MNSVLENIFREMDWEGKGIRINDEYLSNLRFADDVVIVATSCRIKGMAEEFIANSKKAGRIMNETKTKILTNGKTRKMVIGGEDIEVVEEVEYLGQLIFQNGREKKLSRRI